MKQRTLQIRVRPARVAVLVGRDARHADLFLAVRFLSSLWGGRFCPLLAVDSAGNDPLTCFRLSQDRPDFVYGVGVDHEVWAAQVREACQARGYGPLEARYVDNLHDAREEHITAAHVIQHLRQTPVGPGRRERTLRLVWGDPVSPLGLFVRILFGNHYENLGQAVAYAGERLPDNAGGPEFIRTHAGVVSRAERCWLDLAGHGLTPRLVGSMGVPPTVVLVDSLTEDLALFWNLRRVADPDFPVWVIPIPASSVSDPAVYEALKEWLLAFVRYRRGPNFCRVTSATVPEEEQHWFAVRLWAEFVGTHVEHVDVWQPTARLGVVTAFESEEHIVAESAGRSLRFRSPRPKLLEGDLPGGWMVDIVKDTRSGEAPGGLVLPPRPSALAVLNTPGPNTINFSVVLPFGIGIENINAFCSGRYAFRTLYLPTPAEVLEEVLLEGGVQPDSNNEKRACYLPVIRMFGGISDAARNFLGQCGSILRVLQAGPLTPSEILGRARLGKGKLTELARAEMPSGYLARLEPASRRVLQRRSREQWLRDTPGSTELERLLEFWADRGILTRLWRLGPCPTCIGTFWEPRIDISRPILCPGCGTRLRLPPRPEIGYALHRLVGHAMREGIIPVVLVGRFLENLTSEGFFWLPGVKYSRGGTDGDLDFMACCDGHIVVGECKTLETSKADASVWEEVFGQFAQTIEVGKACRAEVAVLAAMAEEFPSDFQARVDALAGQTMRCLLLDRKDLETGRRRIVRSGGIEDNLLLDDLIINPWPEPPRQVGRRQIQTAWGILVY